MKTEFDPAKNEKNVDKHGISLEFGVSIFADAAHLILPSIRNVDGEERMKVIGLVEAKLYTAVFVWRGRNVRFISVRRSNKGEERAYQGQI